MKYNKAFKYRIYPSDSQVILIEKTFGCTRFIYNKMLNDKITYYEKNKKSLHITPASYKKEYVWLKEVDSLALTNTQLQLDKAYKAFFSKNNRFPKYKSKHNKKKSYTTNMVNGNIKIDYKSKSITLPKLGSIKCKYHRYIPNDYMVKSVTVSKSPTNKYYVSILTEYENDIPYRILDSNKSIGLDYSSSSLYVDSNGNSINMPHYYRLLEERLAKENRKLSHMKLHSNNWFRQQNKINKIHERIANQRKDYLHKLSTKLVNSYDYIALEDINLKNISQSLHLGKSTDDNGFGMFRDFLSYKAELNGTKIIKVDKFYPSSKQCHICNYKKVDLTLKDRSWTCPICNTTHNRDENAAINILKEGLRLYNNNCLSDNSIIYNTNNPWAKGDSSLILNSLEFLSEKRPLQTSNS
ncbi:MAG: RNA-guided endonuclease TnpB family protein [Erysipelotrichaceae bacterium]|nr:RNA-guided endonuclease TnpB family protein [Erysipelotrichaceae bacterium]